MNEDSIKLSVIIPVYNAEKYIKRCIESVIAQSCNSYELILVDDGSTDSSANICHEYAIKYSYIRVIHELNSGQIVARRTGVENAIGKYITFIDADDWIEKDYLEILMGEIRKNSLDLVMSNSIILDYGNSTEIRKSAFLCGKYNREAIEKNIFKSMIQDEIQTYPGIFAYIYGKIFLRDKLIELLSEIEEEIHLGEDGAATFCYLLNCSSLTIVECSGYHYMQNMDSVSHKPRFSFFKELKVLQDYLLDKLRHCPNSNIQINIFIRDLLIVVIRNIYHLEMGRILCVPPYELIEKKANLVIYGCGHAGKSFVKQILHSSYANVVGWLDQNCGDIIWDIPVVEPKKIQEMQYDQVLIAITNRDVANQIRKTLIEYEVPSEKIIWKEIYWG